MKKAKKKITTIEGLANSLQKGFEAADKRFDGFARVIQNEFLTIQKKMDASFADLKLEIQEVKRDIEDLKLRMGETAQYFEFRELEKRVRRLEAKIAK